MTRHAEDEVTICASMRRTVRTFSIFFTSNYSLALSLCQRSEQMKAPRIDGRNSDNEMLRTYFWWRSCYCSECLLQRNHTPGFFNRCTYFSPAFASVLAQVVLAQVVLAQVARVALVLAQVVPGGGYRWCWRRWCDGAGGAGAGGAGGAGGEWTAIGTLLHSVDVNFVASFDVDRIETKRWAVGC